MSLAISDFQARAFVNSPLDLAESFSRLVGDTAQKAVNKFVRREVTACGVYCSPVACPTTWCAPDVPDEFQCHNYCDGSTVHLCFNHPCTGFCWQNGC